MIANSKLYLCIYFMVILNCSQLLHMKNCIPIVFLLFILSSCTKELKFEQKKFVKKSISAQGATTEISIDVPIYNTDDAVADSINKALFSVMKEIVFVGEKPFQALDYSSLTSEFIALYKHSNKKSTSDLGWNATIQGNVIYKSESILNIELNHSTFTGGAHGYAGKRSLIFDLESGKLFFNENLFLDEKKFKILAESKFRHKYKMAANSAINANGFMFENDKFQLPQTYFYTPNGFLLFYNVYEIASYAQGNFEVLIPYDEIKPYLKTI